MPLQRHLAATGDRRQGTGDRGPETGDRRQETGDRRQETGDSVKQFTNRGRQFRPLKCVSGRARRCQGNCVLIEHTRRALRLAFSSGGPRPDWR
jgi:hypothetical protein